MDEVRPARTRRYAERGQVVVIAAIGVIAIIAMVALVLEGGNAYAQQRVAQNGADAAANSGTVVLGERLGGATKTDADVAAAVSGSATANFLTSYTAYYTDVAGKPINAAGAVTTAPLAAEVGGGPNNPSAIIPPNAQGVAVGGSRTFGTYFGRVLGFDSFTATADAAAITGLTGGGQFLNVVFPVNITDCSGNGSLGTGIENWALSSDDSPPVGQEYIVPLCKTGSGSFQILDLDPNLTCEEEVLTPPTVSWNLPQDVATDNGNNCAKPIADAVNATLVGKTVLIPICDASCTTSGGSNATYHIIKIAAFYIDYMWYQNNPNSAPECQSHNGLVTIAGNGSSSCLAGWFVKYYGPGDVLPGPVSSTDAISIQLIK